MAIEFDENDITYLDKLEYEWEARAYTAFLLSERRRHLKDIELIDAKIKQVKQKFGWRE